MASPSVHTISKLYFSFFQLKRMKLFTFYIGISAGLSQTIIGKDLHEIFDRLKSQFYFTVEVKSTILYEIVRRRFRSVDPCL